MNRKERLEYALTGADEETLLNIAVKVKSKEAYNLAHNPNSTSKVLETAWNRKRSIEEHVNFVELQKHPNFPQSKLTNVGALALIESLDKDTVIEKSSQDGVTDQWVSSCSFLNDQVEKKCVAIALSNPNNLVSHACRTRLSTRNSKWTYANEDYLYASIKSGIWPLKETNLTSEEREMVLAETPSVEVLKFNLRNVTGSRFSDLAALKNPLTPQDLRDTITERNGFMKDFLKEMNSDGTQI